MLQNHRGNFTTEENIQLQVRLITIDTIFTIISTYKDWLLIYFSDQFESVSDIPVRVINQIFSDISKQCYQLLKET